MSSIQKSPTAKRQIARKRQGTSQPAASEIQDKLQQEHGQQAQEKPPVSQGTSEALAMLDAFADGADASLQTSPKPCWKSINPFPLLRWTNTWKHQRQWVIDRSFFGASSLAHLQTSRLLANQLTRGQQSHNWIAGLLIAAFVLTGAIATASFFQPRPLLYQELRQ
jgi:hypothetical protein